MLALLATAVLAFACGWFLAAFAITNGLRSDIRKLDIERDSIDRQKRMIDAFLDDQVEDKRVELQLGRHKSLTGVLS